MAQGRLQVRFSPPRPRGVQPGSGTCREHNGGGGGWWYRGLKGEQGASEAGSAGCRRSERYVWLLWAGSTLLLCGEGCFAGP